MLHRPLWLCWEADFNDSFDHLPRNNRMPQNTVWKLFCYSVITSLLSLLFSQAPVCPPVKHDMAPSNGLPTWFAFCHLCTLYSSEPETISWSFCFEWMFVCTEAKWVYRVYQILALIEGQVGHILRCLWVSLFTPWSHLSWLEPCLSVDNILNYWVHFVNVCKIDEAAMIMFCVLLGSLFTGAELAIFVLNQEHYADIKSTEHKCLQTILIIFLFWKNLCFLNSVSIKMVIFIRIKPCRFYYSQDILLHREIIALAVLSPFVLIYIPAQHQFLNSCHILNYARAIGLQNWLLPRSCSHASQGCSNRGVRRVLFLGMLTAFFHLTKFV